jgi:hypothetical protein
VPDINSVEFLFNCKDWADSRVSTMSDKRTRIEQLCLQVRNLMNENKALKVKQNNSQSNMFDDLFNLLNDKKAKKGPIETEKRITPSWSKPIRKQVQVLEEKNTQLGLTNRTLQSDNITLQNNTKDMLVYFKKEVGLITCWTKWWRSTLT